MKTEMRFETIDDMAKFVLERTYRATQRYFLEDRTSWEYIDEQAGEEWQKKKDAIIYPGMSDEKKYQAYVKANDKLEVIRPEQKQVVTWSLRESSSSWNSSYIYLSVELGEMLDKIWTRKPPYRGASYENRTSSLTIPGMLKRLGRTDIAQQVKEAEQKAKLEQEKRHRNNKREEIRKAAKNLLDLLTANPDLYPLSELMVPNNLIPLVQLEDEK